MFFCYALPALDKELGEFTEEAGTTRWYFYDADKDAILEDPADIVDTHPLDARDAACLHHREADPRRDARRPSRSTSRTPTSSESTRRSASSPRSSAGWS